MISKTFCVLMKNINDKRDLNGVVDRYNEIRLLILKNNLLGFLKHLIFEDLISFSGSESV